MTFVAVSRGLLYPGGLNDISTGNSDMTVDAATEKAAHIGRLYIDGRAASKTLSTGTIQWRSQASTFANGGTTLDIGIQGVASGAGPIAQPDGTFTVKTTLTGGGGGVANGGWNTTTMNSGTATLNHGDLIAVVWDMTARAGADSVTISGHAPSGIFNSSTNFPITNAFFSAAWQATVTQGAGRVPNIIIVFDDGTLGWIDFSIPATSFTTDTFQDSTNPDERGMIFQVPWDCKIDALWAMGGIASAAADFTLKLYSDPLGTPGLAASVAVLAENLGPVNANAFLIESLASEVSLSKNTDYAVTMLATGSANSRLYNATLGNTAHRATIQGGTTLKKVTRNNSAGAFTAESPAITMYSIGVRISQLHDGAGSSSAVGVIGG